MSQEDDLNARVTSLTRKIEAMELRKAKEVKSIKNKEFCNLCETNEHSTNECPHLPVFKEAMHEQVNAIEYTQKPYPSPYSNTYPMDTMGYFLIS